MPSERRWRQMRVILQDVLKLQREGHREQRLDLDQERLEFAKERFEAGQQSDVRRVMAAFLAAGRQWPEVGEALATAFLMLQERKQEQMEGNKTELGSIKVDQGGENKKEEAPAKLVGCSPSPVSSPPGRGDGLTRFWVQESFTTSTATGEVRMDGSHQSQSRLDQGGENKKRRRWPSCWAPLTRSLPRGEEMALHGLGFKKVLPPRQRRVRCEWMGIWPN